MPQKPRNLWAILAHRQGLSKDVCAFPSNKRQAFIFAVIGRLGGTDFYTLQHSTILTLDPFDALCIAAKTVDTWLDTSHSLSTGGAIDGY